MFDLCVNKYDFAQTTQIVFPLYYQPAHNISHELTANNYYEQSVWHILFYADSLYTISFPHNRSATNLPFPFSLVNTLTMDFSPLKGVLIQNPY